MARYYRADADVYRNVSTEITGYAVSALVYAYRVAGDQEFLEAATRAAHFLTRTAWDARHGTMPFETDPAELSYFFDCGIIARGLLALWRVTGECELVDVALGIAESMARDFGREEGGHWPVLALPEKTPLPTDPARWSLTAGCYQLKSALAWRELGTITGDDRWSGIYADALATALARQQSYLCCIADPHQAMDRLHPYLYFLEALLAHPEHSAIVRDGADRVRDAFDRLAPQFERADVAAQLLRVQCASGASEADCARTAARVREFQRPDGGYRFGRKAGEWIPHVSPVPTTFAMQALEWYERRDSIDCAAVI